MYVFQINDQSKGLAAILASRDANPARLIQDGTLNGHCMIVYDDGKTFVIPGPATDDMDPEFIRFSVYQKLETT